jgi:murein L,D-transpeptidase YcbB/YkuD
MATFRAAELLVAAFVFGALLIAPLAAGAAQGKDWSVEGQDGRARALAAIASHAYRHGVRLNPAPSTTLVGAQYLDSSITEFYVRYAKVVGFGQIKPQAARITWDITRSTFDSNAALAQLRIGGMVKALASLPPSYPEYARLVDALAHYREIAARGGWPAVAKGRILARGSDSSRVPILRRRLAAEGYIATSNVDDRVFDGQVERAVIRFQRRHGLKPDGRVGPKTLAALNQPVAYRIAQIIANLERWRWMPRTLPLPRIEVNVAAAMLRVVDTGGEVLRARVVVGSPRNPTPFLQAEIRKVVINPPWNVPDSIWRKEIFPRLRRNPEFLAARNMRIVGRTHDPYGRQIEWRQADHVPAGIRIQQQPGPLNALGRIKFHLPNRFDVYLHDTPARAAFQRPERALSHGCVRLQKPDALLAYLFRSQDRRPQMSREDDDRPRRTRTVPVAKPLPIFFLYWTAFVAPDGGVHFRKDIYGHDARMTALLAHPDRRVESVLLAAGCSVKPPRT